MRHPQSSDAAAASIHDLVKRQCFHRSRHTRSRVDRSRTIRHGNRHTIALPRSRGPKHDRMHTKQLIHQCRECPSWIHRPKLVRCVTNQRVRHEAQSHMRPQTTRHELVLLACPSILHLGFVRAVDKPYSAIRLEQVCCGTEAECRRRRHAAWLSSIWCGFRWRSCGSGRVQCGDRFVARKHSGPRICQITEPAEGSLKLLD